MSGELIEIVRRAGKAGNRRDIDAYSSLFTADSEIVPVRAALEDTVYRGPDAAARFLADADESWEDLSIEVEQSREGGDWVLTFGRIRARGRASGASIDVRSATVYRFRDGLIRHMRVYGDRSEALTDVGLPPEGDSP
jgi:ketosteroid isomerase-like protein